jgi:hypothetical protein
MSPPVPIRDTSQFTEKTLADLCLGALAENPEELARFLDFAGYTPQGLRTALDSPQLSRGLIEYVAANESLMLSICANAGVKPEQFMAIWYKLNPAG